MEDATATSTSVTAVGWGLGILGVLFAALVTYLAKVWKIGPWNTDNGLDDVENQTESPTTTVIVPETATTPETHKYPTVAEFCLAIRDFEGKPGDANYRNNNPGNVKYSPVGYLPIYEPVRKSQGGFAIFKDYATGWLYLNNFVKSVIHNNPDLTIRTFIGGSGKWPGYAPATDNNPVDNYSNHLAKRLGVTTDFKLKNLVS